MSGVVANVKAPVRTCSGPTQYAEQRDAHGGEALSGCCAFLNFAVLSSKNEGRPCDEDDSHQRDNFDRRCSAR
jgi:hypothetical protein